MHGAAVWLARQEGGAAASNEPLRDRMALPAMPFPLSF